MKNTEQGGNQISRKRRFWEVHIQAWQKSGLSQNKYCRQNQLHNSQLRYWKKKLGLGVPATPIFAPVPIEAPQLDSNYVGDDSGLTIILGSNTHIRLENSFSTSALSKVVAVLRGQS